YAALSPLLVAALFWKRSTKWGALASALWAALSVIAVAVFQFLVPAPPPGPPVAVWAVAGVEVLSRTPGGTAVLGFMPVGPMCILSALLIIAVSWIPSRPSREAINRYFPDKPATTNQSELS